MLVSAIIMAQAEWNSWSELLSLAPYATTDLPISTHRSEFRLHVSNPAQNRTLNPVMVSDRKDEQGASMEPILGSFRHRLRRRLAAIADSFRKFHATFAPPAQQVGSQRMCPFCGLITPRAQRLCLECGKPLRALPVERKDARQG